MLYFLLSGLMIVLSFFVCFFICFIYGLIVWRSFKKIKPVIKLLKIYAVNIEAQMQSQLSLTLPLATCALIVVIFFNQYQTQPLYEASFLFGVITIPLIMVSYSLMRMKVVMDFVNHSVSKLAWVTFGIAGVWLAHAESAGILNSAYGVDASNMPIALSAGTFCKVIGFLSLPVLLLALFIEVVTIFAHVKFKRYSIRNCIRLLSPYCIFILVFISAEAMSSLGITKKSNYLLISIAYEMDFTNNHYCADVRENEKVLIISSKPDRGIAFSEFNDFKKPFRLLTDKDIEKHSPKQGRLVKCL